MGLSAYLLLSKEGQTRVEVPTPSSRRQTRYTLSGQPIVDRSILDRLREIESQAGYVDEDVFEARNADRLPLREDSNGIPPLYRFPDTKPKPKAPKPFVEDAEAIRIRSLVPREQLDPLFCPSQPEGCKFLLAAWIGEQETKAQMHLYQLGLLARSLGRILVLPNVSKSRMFSCAKQPFDYYYAPDALDALGIPSITSAQLAEWSSRRELAPTAQVASVVNAKANGPAEALEVDPQSEGMTVPTAPKRKLCLERPRTQLDFTRFSPVTAYAPVGYHRNPVSRAAFGESLVQTLLSRQLLDRAWRGSAKDKQVYSPADNGPASSIPSPDVLVVNWELRFPVLTPEKVESRSDITVHEQSRAILPFSHFPYAPAWTSLGLQLAASLSPFVAIHWRQETLPASVIGQCGAALVDKLVTLLTEEHPDIKTVYLATDYPIDDLRNGRDGVAARSGTFGRLLTEEHHSAMSSFLQKFETELTEARGIRLATLESEQDKLMPAGQSTSADIADMDAGIVGIIDKTVAIHAQVFLTGEALMAATAGTACGKFSSFTRQIAEARASQWRRGRDDTSRLWSRFPSLFDAWSVADPLCR